MQQPSVKQYYHPSKYDASYPSLGNAEPLDNIIVGKVYVADDTPKSFNILPIEMNQRIAEFLPDDSNLYAFMLTCRSARDAIEGDGQSFWRRRFLAAYEKPKQFKSNAEYKETYFDRSLDHFRNVTFSLGQKGYEVRCLQVIRDIIVESFSGVRANARAIERECANLSHLLKILEACPSLLDTIFDPLAPTRPQRNHMPQKPHTLLQTIQVILAPYLLRVDSGFRIYRFPDSQRQAYLPRPLFKGQYGLDVDMDWLLHQLNFWRFHLTRREENTLYQAYTALESSEMPRFWQGPLTDDPGLIGRFFKGAYAFLNPEDLVELRVNGNESGMLEDTFGGLDSCSFQDLELELLSEGDETWPELFEHHLRALAEPKRRHTKTRSQARSPEPDATTTPRSFRFRGDGQDSEDFIADGWLTTLPSQSGIPGWQRLSMMKYWLDEYDTIDTSSLWAYEGIVLPGGQLIIGRWWSPTSTGTDEYSGPFIFWCVDSPEHFQGGEDDMSPEL